MLVTGGAGYIGSHACKALAKAGFLPIAYDSLAFGHEWAAQWGPLEIGDIADRKRLDAVIARHQPIAIMHFAAFAYVSESVTNPGKYYRNNVAGTLTLLDAILDAGINKFIFSSTCATYGIPKEIPINEETSQRPINPYGHSKLMIEQILRDYGKAHDLRWIALRYFNAAGADPDLQIGEDHDPETHLIPLVLDAAAGRREAITIFGSDYDTPDGTCIRDYVHVSDLADAHVLALQALEKGQESSPFNLGNGRGFSNQEVIAAVERVTGLQVPRKTGDRREGDPACLIADASRAKEALGWMPEFADIEAIIATAWAWHQKQPQATRSISAPVSVA